MWTQANAPGLQKMMFAMLDGRDIAPLIYKGLEDIAPAFDSAPRLDVE